MVTMPEGYYSTFEPSQNYEQVVFRAGKVLQSRELVDVEKASQHRLRQVADVLFKDGSVIRDARIFVNAGTGECILEAGVVYVRGAMRGVAPATVTIPVTGTVVVGLYMQDSIVTEITDGGLRDPAIGARNYGEPGAHRLKVVAVWGVAGDGTSGEFYPVYTVVDGQPIDQQPPPQIDAVSLAIASYDRQSAGGYYVSTGLTLKRLPDEAGNQVYSLSEGVARVDGREVVLEHARRVVYAAQPDLKRVLGEPHTAVGGAETITLRHGPIAQIDQVLIRTRKVLTGFTRGPSAGGSDVLPDSPILSIVHVNQGGTWNAGTNAFDGGTTFVQGTDYKLTGDSVDWSLAGASTPTEPATQSTYSVVYEYTLSITATNITETTIDVSGAVAGSTTTVSYRWKRPRYDRLCLSPTGQVVWVQGVANDVTPIKPQVGPGLLGVASVLQTWGSDASVADDGVRLVPMNQLERMQNQIDDLFNVVSDHQLRTEAAISDPTTKKGIFTDPFVDDSKRDAGVAQTAACFDGILTLGMTGVSVFVATLADDKTHLPLNAGGTTAIIQQPLKTGDMKVNPYDSFTPIPASCALNPALDFWTQRETSWASTVTRQFERRRTNTSGPQWGLLTRFIGSSPSIVVENAVEIAGETTRDAQFLRQIPIAFTLTGFGAGENLTTVKFDGVSIDFTA